MIENQTDTATLPPPAIPRPKYPAEPPIDPPAGDELLEIAQARAKRLQAKRDTLLRRSAEQRSRAASLRQLLAEIQVAINADVIQSDKLASAIDALQDGSEPFTPTQGELEYRAAVLRQRVALGVYQSSREKMDSAYSDVLHRFGKGVPDTSKHAAAADKAENASKAFSLAFNAFADAREAVRTAQYALETESQSL